ncbi:MAG: cobalamin B12-binding domain-containing protein, partial [Chloroflexi bacterium]|nr:cobalamin B12-binding domain-containing protein [Chloroflexota bacterium]
MRILLVYPRWGQVDRFPGRPPIGLGYLASYLREHESIIFDQQVDPRPLDSVIMDSAPNVVGFSVSTWTFRQVLDTIKVLKGEYRSIIWVAGGPHP